MRFLVRYNCYFYSFFLIFKIIIFNSFILLLLFVIVFQWPIGHWSMGRTAAEQSGTCPWISHASLSLSGSGKMVLLKKTCTHVWLRGIILLAFHFSCTAVAWTTTPTGSTLNGTQGMRMNHTQQVAVSTKRVSPALTTLMEIPHTMMIRICISRYVSCFTFRQFYVGTTDVKLSCSTVVVVIVG